MNSREPEIQKPRQTSGSEHPHGRQKQTSDPHPEVLDGQNEGQTQEDQRQEPDQFKHETSQP